MWRALWLTMFVACNDSQAPTTMSGPDVYVEARKVASGEPIVLHAPPTVTVPTVTGLTATSPGQDTEGRMIWELRGKDGSYIIPIGDPPQRIFVDIGVDGPSGGPMADLAAPPPPPAPIWPYVAAGLGGAAALAGVGVLVARRMKRPLPPPPPEPPAVIARRQWAALRARTDLTPEQLALDLSRVYRTYLEATHDWQATARTTREIVDVLAGELTAAELERARRLLSAMDLVKFSDRSAHAGLFDTLDEDFHQLVPRV